MNADIFAWIVPFALATFSVVFLTLRLYGMGSNWWGAAFLCIAFAFGSSLVPVAEGAIAKPLLEDIAFLGAFLCLAKGIARRLGAQANPVVLYGAATVALLGAAAALTGWSSVRGELIFIQMAGSAILLEGARMMWRTSHRAPDRMLFALTLLFAANLAAQSLAVAVFADPAMTVATWARSPWGFALQISGATAGVLFAVAILLAIGRDVVDALRAMSETDPLSGVLNRRGFDIRSEALRHRIGRKQPVGLILFDIDHFKRINDRHGHAGGDAVICGVAELAHQLAGENGLVGRLGGEEFAVLMPGLDLRSAHAHGERMRLALSHMRWPQPMGGMHLSASFGVTTLNADELLGDGIQRADRLLYIAKSRGRDQVFSAAGGSRIILPEADGIAEADGSMEPAGPAERAPPAETSAALC